MKIHQLPDGARFEYEGEEYMKTGPMFATGKGGQRLIPRYAVLKPIGDAEIAHETKPNDSLPRAVVLNAFESFYWDCKAVMPENLQIEIDAARKRYLKALDGADY